MKKCLVVFGLLLTTVFMPTISEAVCDQYGYIVRVTAKPGAANSLIYLRNTALANFTYMTSTADNKLIDAALNALNSRTRVLVRGGGTACPSTGEPRSMGATAYIIVSP